MRKLLALLLPVFAGLGVLACEDQLPDQPSATMEGGQLQAGHQAEVTATAVLNALKTQAAKRNGFSFGEEVGQITVTDDGHDNLASGSASGLEDDVFYISLFYDVQSTVEGPRACEPAVHNSNDEDFITDAQMLGGIWLVDASGDGTLADLDNEYVPLDKIRTVSIRDTRIGGGFGPQAVVACGILIDN